MAEARKLVKGQIFNNERVQRQCLAGENAELSDLATARQKKGQPKRPEEGSVERDSGDKKAAVTARQGDEAAPLVVIGKRPGSDLPVFYTTGIRPPSTR